ncbi:MAG: serine/threonine-protein kinase [Zavarzinella sp.]
MNKYDVFLSCPMASVRSQAQYQDVRSQALAIKQCLQEECGLTVYFAGDNVDSKDSFDEPDFSFIQDREALNNSRYFLLFYPSRIVSSVLVEAGMAIAQEKKAVYFVFDRKHLPFMLQHVDRVCPIKIYEIKSIDRVLKLFRDHGANLFEPWQDKPPVVKPEPLTTSHTQTLSTPVALAPNAVVGPYTLVKLLGSGTYGTVWLAEKRTAFLTTQFALKFPNSPELNLDAIRHEALVWSMVSGHPNIVPVIEADRFGGHVVIVSEYAANGSLAEWLATHQQSKSTAQQLHTWGKGIIAGLAHLHECGLVHRDLKPNNILIQGNIPKIADFGLARVLASIDQSYSVAGTPAYMAPEAWAGQRSEQTDIWAVGVILFEMFAGERPFQEKSVPKLRQLICSDYFPAFPDSMPAVVQQVIHKCFERDCQHRYQKMTEVQSDFAELS